MAKVQVLEDKQTSNGRIVKTERVWTTEDGHKVVVTTDACISGRATYAARYNSYSRTQYVCECGRTFRSNTVPSKNILAKHNAWHTEEQREQIAQVFAASFGTK